MTERATSTSPSATDGWSANLSAPVRIALLAVCGIALVFSVGVVVGMGVAFLERGSLTPLGALALAVAIALVALLGWLCWRLAAYWRRPGQSAYERRYTRTMLLLVCAGLPVGVLLAVASDGETYDPFWSNGPLDPLLAGIAALTLTLVLVGALIVYHRSIDDHEQQAYLWANSLAFYFLAIALPAAWLLARGGLIAPLGIGGAMLILLAAFVINFTVWAWLKYR